MPIMAIHKPIRTGIRLHSQHPNNHRMKAHLNSPPSVLCSTITATHNTLLPPIVPSDKPSTPSVYRTLVIPKLSCLSNRSPRFPVKGCDADLT
jgi:hypothetical protein